VESCLDVSELQRPMREHAQACGIRQEDPPIQSDRIGRRREPGPVDERRFEHEGRSRRRHARCRCGRYDSRHTAGATVRFRARHLEHSQTPAWGVRSGGDPVLNLNPSIQPSDLNSHHLGIHDVRVVAIYGTCNLKRGRLGKCSRTEQWNEDVRPPNSPSGQYRRGIENT